MRSRGNRTKVKTSTGIRDVTYNILNRPTGFIARCLLGAFRGCFGFVYRKGAPTIYKALQGHASPPPITKSPRGLCRGAQLLNAIGPQGFEPWTKGL